MDKTVYVVSYEYTGGGGFDWYWKESDAKEAYQDEVHNGGQQDTFYFEYKVSPTATAAEITAEIDEQLIELCEKATIKHLRKINN